MIDFKVDEERCIQCGECVKDCPFSAIVMNEGEYPTVPNESKCIRCQHCLAVCPTAAVSILGVSPEQCLELGDGVLPSGDAMAALVMGRRSIRQYKQENLSRGVLEKLLRTAWHAPTGVNAQDVHFTATTDITATQALREATYTRLDDLLGSTVASDDTFARQYIRMAYSARTEYGLDVIFRNCPHILVASTPRSSLGGKENCLIALSTFDLLAQSMGVGTLWNGMLKWCLADFFPELSNRLGVPDDHSIVYAMSFGPPAVSYPRTVLRTPAKLHLAESF